MLDRFTVICRDSGSSALCVVSQVPFTYCLKRDSLIGVEFAQSPEATLFISTVCPLMGALPACLSVCHIMCLLPEEANEGITWNLC